MVLHELGGLLPVDGVDLRLVAHAVEDHERVVGGPRAGVDVPDLDRAVGDLEEAVTEIDDGRARRSDRGQAPDGQTEQRQQPEVEEVLGRRRRLEVGAGFKLTHLLPALLQTTLYLYWALYWPGVRQHLPLVALLYLLTAVATLRTKVRRFSFSGMLFSEAIAMAVFACNQPWGIIVLLAVLLTFNAAAILVRQKFQKPLQ